MYTRRIRCILFAAVFLLAGSRAAESADGASPDTTRTIARIHWLGMKQLAGETNAAHLMAIWNLPESRRLGQQMLEKLSLAPWPLLHRSPDTNAAARLRPLLDDLAENESCLEIRQTSNQPGELVLAIRLDDQRAALWQTNLARVLESLTGIHPVPAPGHDYGWSLKKHHDPDFLELTRAGGWTIVGAAEDRNDLLNELRDRIQHGQVPVATENADDWLEADLDPVQLISSLTTLNFELSTLNHFHLTVTGDGTNVLMYGTADFTEPLLLDLEPWNIPTNLIDEHLSSFTAIRGLQPWLESLPAWNNLQIGSSPDQICFWAVQGFPMQSYFAAPFPDASNEVDRLAGLVLHKQPAWFGTNGLATFVRSKQFNGLEWKGPPYMMPFLRSITVGSQDFVYGGGLQNPNINLAPLPPDVLGRTNLIYYDSEQTGLRSDQWLYVGQFARFVSNKAQLPTASPGVHWLLAVAPKLGASFTDITQTGPRQLTFTRRSSIGFTGIELHLLADWLESPRFPYGLYSLLAPPPSQ
jgi:hypothetical protein